MPKKGKNQRKRSSPPGQMLTNIAATSRVPRVDFLSTHIGSTPQRARRTLTWSVTPGLYSVAALTYSEPAVTLLNSPYDPDAALGGVSAMGFAKMMTFYSKCFTLGARVTVRVVSSDTSDAFPIVCGLTITTNSNTLASVYGATTVGICAYDVVGNSPDHRRFTLGVDIGRFLDKPIVLDDPQLFCTSVANPGQVIVSHFWAYNGNLTTATNLFYTLEVEYDVVFTDPIPFT